MSRLKTKGWNYAFVPAAVILSPKLASTDVRVYAYLLWRAGQDGSCFPGVETTAKDLHMGESTVRKAYRHLIADDWIRRVRRVGHSSLTYIFETQALCRAFSPSAILVADEALPEEPTISYPSSRLNESQYNENQSNIGANAPNITSTPSVSQSEASSRAGNYQPPEAQEEEPQAFVIELEVPQGGNARRRAEYLGTCPECHCKTIAQSMDRCPGKNCGLPVHWTGSKTADDRYREQANHATDRLAKKKRARAPLSDFTGFVLAWAREGAAVPESVDFIRGEEAQLLAYERQIGAEVLRGEIARIMGKDKPPAGRGRILNLLRSVPYMAARAPEPEEPVMVEYK